MTRPPGTHGSTARVVGAAAGAVLTVAAYVYGVLDHGDVLDPALVVVFALIGLFNGWLLLSIISGRPPDHGDGSGGAWASPDGRRSP